MPRTRSDHNHHPALTVAYSASTLARWGFFPAILRYLQRLALPQRLRGVTIPSAPNAHFQPVDKLMTLVTVFITGIARISHIDRTLVGETALARTLGLDRFPSSPCLGSVAVSPWGTRVEFWISHYITVSSPAGGSGGFSSVSFKAFRTRRASGEPPLTPRRVG